MGVDQPRQDHHVSRVDHAIGIGRQVITGAHCRDHTVVHQDGAIGNLATLGVHGDEHPSMPDEDGGHRPS